MALSIAIAGTSAHAQQIGTVTPAQATVATGVTQNLVFTASYAPTAQPDLNVEITASGFNAGCWLRATYNGGQPLLELHDGYTGGLTGPVSFGGAPLSNSFCQVTSTNQGFLFDNQGNVTLTVAVTFTTLMAGQSLVYIEDAVDDATNNSSGWWAQPGDSLTLTSGSLGPPTLGTLTLSTPSVPPSQPMTLQVTPTDPNGWSYVDEIWVRISPNHDGTNACMVLVIPDQSFMALFTDDQSSWTAVPFGGNPPAQNSQCTLNGQGSSLTYNGQTVSTSTNVTVTLNLQFSPSFRGSNFVDEYIWDSAFSTTAGWGTLGNLNVAAPPIITSGAYLPFGVAATPGYRGNVTAQGGSGSYTWSADGLPPGLSMDPSSGTITGKPIISGNFSPTITVRDAQSSSATASPTIQVLPSGSTPTPQATSQSPMPITKVGVFRNNTSFLEDSNGDGTWENTVDRFIMNFTGPGGFATGDVPVAGDWVGDGKSRVGIYRPSTGTWYLDYNNDGVYDAGDLTYTGFGGCPNQQYCPDTQDIPVVGDWTGTGKSCIGISRVAPDGIYWMLDLNCDGVFETTPTDSFFPYGGLAGDVPVVGKWTGATTRVGVVRKYAPNGVPTGSPFY